MKTDIKKIDKENEKIIDSYDYMANAASTQDCTGLIPANPMSEEELESYEDVYNYKAPVIKKEKNEPILPFNHKL